MSYVVLEDFTDLKDKRKVYRKGGSYPRPSNKNVSEKRLKELTTASNRIGAPLIKKVEVDFIEEEIVEEAVEEQVEKKAEKKKKQNKKSDKEQN